MSRMQTSLIGQGTRRLHGAQPRGERITACRVLQGPQRAGSIGPKIATTGTPNEAARWTRPVSIPRQRSIRAMSAAVSRSPKPKLKSWILFATFGPTSSLRRSWVARSAGPPQRKTSASWLWTMVATADAKRSIGHCFDGLVEHGAAKTRGPRRSGNSRSTDDAISGATQFSLWPSSTSMPSALSRSRKSSASCREPAIGTDFDSSSPRPSVANPTRCGILASMQTSALENDRLST